MANMMKIAVVLTFIAGTYAANYSWPFYPIANQALYGYDLAANRSFRSESVPSDARIQVEGGIHSLFVPAGVQVDLGDFADTCISNPTLCKNFTVSFLFKTSTDKELKVLDSGVKDGETYEYGWSFEISSFFDAKAMVSNGDSEKYAEKLAATNAWIQMVFTFDPDSRSSSNVVLYQNGSHGNPPIIASNCELQDKNTRLKLGSPSNKNGFFISNLKFIGIKLSDKEIQELGNNSFKEAMEVHNVTIEVLEAQVIIQAEAGIAAIPVHRRGFLGIATAINYDTKGLTALPTKHFKAATGKQLAFAPGEIYKDVRIGIINTDNTIEGNKTFKVIFSSSHSSVTLTGPKHVNITIMYTKGIVSKGATTNGIVSKGATTNGIVSKGATTNGYHCFPFVLINLLGVLLLLQ